MMSMLQYQSVAWQPEHCSRYVEMHFRRPWFPWHPLYRRLPEVVFDAPSRVPAGSTHFPLLLTIKDAHLFPVELCDIRVEFAGPPGSVYSLENSYRLTEPWASHQFQIPLPPGQQFVRCRVRFRLHQGTGISGFLNDSYSGRYRPFTVTVNTEATPRLPGSFRGDLHFHSNLSNDQVEFGAPLPLLKTAMQALELDFVAVTDHSYDLKSDDQWQRLQTEIAILNAQDSRHLLLPAEEVSVRSSRGSNIHLLVLNDPRRYPGSGDSGRVLNRRSELDLPMLLRQLDSAAIAIAAHPGERPGRLEKRLLRRTAWEESDCDLVSLFQVANGSNRQELASSLNLWRRQLGKNRRVFLVAGNDAHGDFNQSRRMRIPFFSIGRSNLHRTGWWQTVLFADRLDIGELVNSIRKGRSLITTGPQMSLEQNGVFMPPGLDENATLQLHLRSSSDYGHFAGVELHLGGGGVETTLQLELRPEMEQTLDLSRHIKRDFSYLRLSGTTVLGHHCFSNPLFHENLQ